MTVFPDTSPLADHHDHRYSHFASIVSFARGTVPTTYHQLNQCSLDKRHLRTVFGERDGSLAGSPLPCMHCHTPCPYHQRGTAHERQKRHCQLARPLEKKKTRGTNRTRRRESKHMPFAECGEVAWHWDGMANNIFHTNKTRRPTRRPQGNQTSAAAVRGVGKGCKQL